ncbi:hypothetical protein [Mycobacterium sp. 155]|uniref:hypothetical protein n=1 Tax=Mycobacterium sp. 155 TaxID=1157943 RepID=UPI000380896D|nr:hypothetical protein [Mycobacterium sp. 155]
MPKITNLTDTRWDMGAAPSTPAGVVNISAWTTDEELSRLAANMHDVYGSRSCTAADRQDVLRTFRTYLREAAMIAEGPAADALRVQFVLEDGVAERITATSTDEHLDLLLNAAEAGAGGNIPGLAEALLEIRAAGGWRGRVSEVPGAGRRDVAERVGITTAAVDLIRKAARDLHEERAIT